MHTLYILADSVSCQYVTVFSLLLFGETQELCYRNEVVTVCDINRGVGINEGAESVAGILTKMSS